jgi:hypothetical protein
MLVHLIETIQLLQDSDQGREQIERLGLPIEITGTVFIIDFLKLLIW